MLQLLSIERQTPSRFCLWIRDGDKYKAVIQEDDKPFEELHAVPVADCKDYDQFEGVMGKFNPWTIFNDVPVDVPDLDFDRVEELAL